DGSTQSLALGSAGAASFVSGLVADGSLVYALSFNEDRIYAVDLATLQPASVLASNGAATWIPVGPGGVAAKGPTHAAVWTHAGRKHLLVLLTLSNSMTDILLP